MCRHGRLLLPQDRLPAAVCGGALQMVSHSISDGERFENLIEFQWDSNWKIIGNCR